MYLFKGAQNKILYVGKATSLKSRVNSYFRGKKTKGSRLNELRAQIRDVDVQAVGSPLESAMLENDLIKRHDPPYNRALRVASRELVPCGRRGPLTQARALATLQEIMALRHSPTMMDDFAIDDEIFAAGLELYEESAACEFTTDRFDHLLAKALVRGIERDRTRLAEKLAAEEEDDETEEVADKSDPSDEDTEPEMTPELVARMIAGQVSGIARQMFRVRWMTRLADCDLIWKEKKWCQLSMREGEPTFSMLARKPRKLASAPPSSEFSIPDIHMFDRLTVLLCLRQILIWPRYRRNNSPRATPARRGLLQ